MSRFRIIRTVAKKELVESFRDRRTLFLMIFLPILLYPVLILVVTQVAFLQATKLEEASSAVALVGCTEDHPLAVRLLDDERVEVSFPSSEDASLDRVDTIVEFTNWDPNAEGPAQMLLRYSSTDEASRLAFDRVDGHIADWVDVTLEARLAAHGLDPSWLEPVNIESIDESPPKRRGGYALGAILPMLVIATVLLGAFYPAIDLTAGEKERGSIQTLFTAPVSAFSVVVGKYLAVLCIAMISGMANLLSMALIFSQNLFLSAEAAGEILQGVDFSLSAGVLLALFVTIILMALFFSAVLMTVAVLARSYKEGQSYLGPVYLACFLPAMVAQMPGFELTPTMAMVPAVNVTLLMKQILVQGVSLDLVFLTAVSTLIFTMFALLMAAKLFAQESIVLGERGSLKLLVRGAKRLKNALRPSVGEGLAIIGVCFLLLFYVGTIVQSRDPQTGLIITLWGLILLPPLLLSRYLKLNLRETFNLRRPKMRGWLAALILGASSWVVVAAVNMWISENFMPMPPGLDEQMRDFLPSMESAGDWIGVFAVIAISPAICEEALFRGFLFSSLRERVRPWVLIVLTGLIFGAFHLSIYRFFGTAVLGILMGLLVYKTGSIYTSVLFHALNNGAALLVLMLAPQLAGESIPWPVVAGAGALMAVGVWLLSTCKSPWAPGSPPALAAPLQTTKSG